MRLESDMLRELINDCGSMIRKYQDDDTKKDIRGFTGGNKLSNLQKKERKFSNKNLENVEEIRLMCE